MFEPLESLFVISVLTNNLSNRDWLRLLAGGETYVFQLKRYYVKLKWYLSYICVKSLFIEICCIQSGYMSIFWFEPLS